jgi:hypothetical protein
MTVQPHFLDPSKKKELWPKCEKVLQLENFDKLPQYSAVCLFDNVDDRQAFLGSYALGKEFCGFFRALREPLSRNEYWPRDILQHIRDDTGQLYDVVIYLRQRTCQSEVGTVITFAHELQHFMQYGFSRKVWSANHCIKDLPEIWRKKLPPWSLPYEYEAQLVSKRSAERVFDKKMVELFAKQRKEAKSDPKKWEFFLGLNVQESFNLLQRTIELVDENREALLERFPAKINIGIDFAKERWWE